MPPRFRDLKRFIEKTGWVLVKQTDHWYFEKVLPDGRILRTKISFALHKEIPASLWQFILKKQLALPDEESFWLGVGGKFKY
ncbi:MAG TPA: hypothetical protein GX509_08940 [Firmicutes bacterium]|nr:hypothetical protein [Bacillota bacterium]HHY98851.1 hypothetical protein [Bacillota bacterium]